jgi:cilia- and flagella-associated protein 65
MLPLREPGGEYAKKLVIKNVAKNLQTIKYRLPDTKFFFMNFPEKIPLSAGMSFVVNIKFRPIEEEEYDDVVEFETPRGRFFIRIKATLRRMGFEACKAIDFGYCPVNETSSRDFEIRNTGELSLDFSWCVVFRLSVSLSASLLLIDSLCLPIT